MEANSGWRNIGRSSGGEFSRLITVEGEMHPHDLIHAEFDCVYLRDGTIYITVCIGRAFGSYGTMPPIVRMWALHGLESFVL